MRASSLTPSRWLAQIRGEFLRAYRLLASRPTGDPITSLINELLHEEGESIPTAAYAHYPPPPGSQSPRRRSAPSPRQSSAQAGSNSFPPVPTSYTAHTIAPEPSFWSNLSSSRPTSSAPDSAELDRRLSWDGSASSGLSAAVPTGYDLHRFFQSVPPAPAPAPIFPERDRQAIALANSITFGNFPSRGRSLPEPDEPPASRIRGRSVPHLRLDKDGTRSILFGEIAVVIPSGTEPDPTLEPSFKTTAGEHGGALPEVAPLVLNCRGEEE